MPAVCQKLCPTLDFKCSAGGNGDIARTVRSRYTIEHHSAAVHGDIAAAANAAGAGDNRIAIEGNVTYIGGVRHSHILGNCLVTRGRGIPLRCLKRRQQRSQNKRKS